MSCLHSILQYSPDIVTIRAMLNDVIIILKNDMCIFVFALVVILK